VKRVIALISLSTALLLAGCSQVGAAATVGSTKISQSTVQKSIDGILAERAKVDTAGMQLVTGAELNRSQLRFHLISVLLGAVAADEKITITKAEIDTRRATIITQLSGEKNLPKALVGANISSADFPEYLQLILQSEKIAQFAVAGGVAQANSGTAIQKLVIAKAAKLNVTVNPQYGKWDAATGDVVATDVASPAASPAATK
jgi:hypothetical protein